MKKKYIISWIIVIIFIFTILIFYKFNYINDPISKEGNDCNCTQTTILNNTFLDPTTTNMYLIKSSGFSLKISKLLNEKIWWKHIYEPKSNADHGVYYYSKSNKIYLCNCS